MGHVSVLHYFAYGSNMDVERVRSRAMPFVSVCAATLPGYALVFDKVPLDHEALAHANIAPRLNSVVEGVLYELPDSGTILVMDRFERTPVNYSRDVVSVETDHGPRFAWTYFANPAVRRLDRRPGRQYLQHLLAGAEFLSAPYVEYLRSREVVDE